MDEEEFNHGVARREEGKKEDKKAQHQKGDNHH